MNKRRKLVIALGAGALVAPFGAFAQQQGKVWRVGFLATRSRPVSLDSDAFGGFPRGMQELGYVEGRNLKIEWRFADGNVERLPELAAELVQLKVDIIVVQGVPATRAAQKMATAIPIIMGTIPDPVGNGFVASLARPGGNITGLSNLTGDLGPKYLEMMLSAVPRISRVAVLVNPNNPSHPAILKSIEAGAHKPNVKILPVDAGTPQEIDRAFAVIIRERVGAIIMPLDSFFFQNLAKIAELAIKYRLPSISPNPNYPEAGGLMSYGPSLAGQYRRVATFVDKIFKGAKPADLPVEQATIFELFINAKTAKTLGLTIPQSLMVSADKVIE